MKIGDLSEFTKLAGVPGLGAWYGASTAKKGRGVEGAVKGEVGSLLGALAGSLPGFAMNMTGRMKRNPALTAIGMGTQAAGTMIGGFQGAKAFTKGTRKKQKSGMFTWK